MEHLTYEDIEEKFPEEYAAREVNKLTYRYPSGESYQVSGTSNHQQFSIYSLRLVLCILHTFVWKCWKFMISNYK